MKTRTGNFPIGFRFGGAQWQNNVSNLIEWAKTHEFEAIDFGTDGDQSARKAVAAGLRVGSVDLLDWKNMIIADKGVRTEAISHNINYIESCASVGALNHFVVMLPQDPSLPRIKNFGYMVESFNQLASVLEVNQARLVIEGWPGPGALCCTPEGYRAFFRECDSSAMGVNYDASHLIRMGIDYLRFLQEFGARVYHVHGKDTEIFSEYLYEYGHEQAATFAEPIRYGSNSWRYCIPGHGANQWKQILLLLVNIGYLGCISIELEDSNFCGNAEAEKKGLLQGAHFLSGCQVTSSIIQSHGRQRQPSTQRNNCAPNQKVESSQVYTSTQEFQFTISTVTPDYFLVTLINPHVPRCNGSPCVPRTGDAADPLTAQVV